MEAKPGIVLLSGGLDSATTLAMAQHLGYKPYALTVNYGQRHRAELAAAADIARHFGAEHIYADVNLRLFGGSALTSDIPVPHGRSDAEMSAGIPVTYVPARNTIFLSLALGWAEALGALDIFIGVNAIDYSGYPDCRPEFIRSFEATANLATKIGVEGRHITIHAPLLQLTKAEIIRRGLELGVDYSKTLSCYDPTEDGGACGTCDTCRLRMKGFAELGLPDPARYRIV